MINTYKVTVWDLNDDKTFTYEYKCKTAAQAKYQCYKFWKEAYRPQFKDPFKYFIKHILEKVEKLEAPND